MNRIVSALLFLVAFSTNARACDTLSKQLAHDEPLVKEKLLALKHDENISGIRLCDKSVVLKGWRFIRRAKVQGPLQHILLFQNGHSTQAVAWVESRGKEIAVPACGLEPRCNSLPEGAAVISGDAYTFNTVKPRGNLVILRYPPTDW